MKRLLSIQDISCFGKCSQTAALPVISALGIETVILPTAILSTHTGKFENYTFLSLEEEMKKITEHWKKLNLTFDAIYVGYIGTTEQVQAISEIIKDFSDENTVIYIDPAMADDAQIYSGLDDEYVDAIKQLCSKADIISPNIYEAMLLADGVCTHDVSFENGKRLLSELKKLCPKTIVTGTHLNDKIVTIGYDVFADIFTEKINFKIDGTFYGTGDVFAGSFIGSYLNGLSFNDAINFADDFVQKCIGETLPEADKYWYGINYESCLHFLTEFYTKFKSKEVR